MVDFSRFNASGDDRRDELIRAIEHAVEHLTQGDLIRVGLCGISQTN